MATTTTMATPTNTSDSEVSKLTLLLPTTPYTLAYTLPLLLLSVLLIFSGTFLTLDRTRSFPPKKGAEYSAVPGFFELKPKKRRFSWYLEGGIGGMAIGYTFGVHLSTLLSLLIPATTSATSLSPQSFVAVWILSCLPTTILGGRYRPAALIFAGLEGGALISLGISVILHPSLLPRLILLGVFTTLFTCLILVSAVIPRLSACLLHPALRVCTSATGAFGLVVSVALLVSPRVGGWADVWERLWVHNGEWGEGKEQGLSAAWGILWIVGVGSDWAMRRWVGECPDEKWDDYLTKYVSDLPNHKDRAGTFQPLTGFWDKLFSAPKKDYDLFDPKKGSKDIVFPSDKDMKIPFASPFNVQPFTDPPPFTDSPHGLKRQSSISKAKLGEDEKVEVMEVPSATAFLKKSRSQKAQETLKSKKRNRKPVKFGAIDSDSSDSDAERSLPIKLVKASRPWVITNQQPSYSSSTPTLVGGAHGQKASEHADTVYPEADPAVDVDYDKELEELKKLRGDKFGRDVEEGYSDREDGGGDLGLQRTESPKPLRQHSTPPSTRRQSEMGAAGETWTPAFMQRHRQESLSPPSISGAIPVPATPSLIRAVDRIQKAQREVYASSPLSRGHDGLPNSRSSHQVDDLRLEDGVKSEEHEMNGERGRSPRWEDFWREVRVKAQT